MVALRSRRLERIFGTTVGELVCRDIEAIVPSGVTEAYDLDFKSQLYGGSEKDKRDLASDVAAMANTAGGVILLGIEEDKQGRAIGTPGVSIADRELTRMRQIVASQVGPLPIFDLLPVEDPTKPGFGYIVVAVPRSPTSPHAVMINDSLRFPRRHGTTTTYLTEPEVAAAYRSRFTGLQSRLDEAERIESDFITRLDLSEQAFLVLTLVPDLPGSFTLDAPTFEKFQNEILGRHPLLFSAGVSFNTVSVRRRRLVAIGLQGSDEAARYLACELFESGAGAFGSVAAHRARKESGSVIARTDIEDEFIVNIIAGGLRFLAHHARDRAAAGGNASVRATLVPVQRDLPAQLVHKRGFPEVLGRQRIYQPPVADGLFDIDGIAENGESLLRATYTLASGIFQDFGQPEAVQLSSDGAIRIQNWQQSLWPRIQAYATSTGVRILRS